MNIPRSPEMQTNIALAWDMGDVMHADYWQEGPLRKVIKPDGTIALETDLKVSLDQKLEELSLISTLVPGSSSLSL